MVRYPPSSRQVRLWSSLILYPKIFQAKESSKLVIYKRLFGSHMTHFKPPCMFFSHGLRMQIFSEFVKLDGQKVARVMYTYILDEKYTFLVIIFISNRIRRSICPKKCSKMVNFDEKKSSFMKFHTLRNRQSPTK